jgi:hypothetical protein
MDLFGNRATLRLRKESHNPRYLLGGFAEILGVMYGEGMKIGVHLSGGEWGLFETIARQCGPARFLRIHTLRLKDSTKSLGPRAIDTRIRSEAPLTQDMDKGFDIFNRRCKDLEPVIATIGIQDGFHGEYGRAVYK